MKYKNKVVHDVYREVKSYAVACLVLYFLIMCLVICVIVSCACLTTNWINASNAYIASQSAEAMNYYANLENQYTAGIAAACGVCIFFILVFEISVLVINIIGIVKASQIPTSDHHRSSIFALEIICLVLSFFIGLLAWIPAAILVGLANKAYHEHQSQANSQQPELQRII